MSLEFVNRICPNCKNPNYMVLLGDYSKAYKYKCMNCNRYFNDIDFEKESLQPYMNDKTDSIVFSLKEARKAIEQAANESDILKKYGHDSVPYLYYAKGIRDACWTIDDIIEKLKEDKKNES